MSSKDKSTKVQSSKQNNSPKLRFREFRNCGPWKSIPGDLAFEQVVNKDHASDLPVLAITQEHGAIPRDQIDYHVSVAEKSIAGYKVVEVGDFIISLRSFQGGIEYSSYRGICSPAYNILRAKKMDFNPYFRHYFKSERFIGSLNKNLEGIRDGKMVSWQQFSDLVLPMPSPKERNTITACLSSVDVLIDAETRKLNAIESHKKGLMQQLFPAEGKTVPRLRFSEFANAREWRSATLGEFFETSSGGTPERSKAEYWGGNIPWISTSLVDFNRITQANEFITEEGMKCSSAKLFPARTILIAMYGQGQTRGKVAILDFASTTNQACAAILPQKGIDPDFVFLYLSSRYEELRALSNSGGQENLSQSLIKGFTIAIPWDTDEQKKIKLCLSRLGEVSRQQGLRVESLLRHKSGLMQQLFPVIEEVQE